MNKKLIALAVAAAITVPTYATAAPSVGGHVQVELSQKSIDNNKSEDTEELKLTDNKRGRFWIKGNEDLGGGLKSIYKFEFQVDTSEGVNNGLSGQRVTMVGFKGGFGEVSFGRRNSPYKLNAGVDFDPYNATELQSRGNGGALKTEGSMSAAYGQNSFIDNSITYKNSFGPVKLHAIYELNESVVQDNIFGLAVRFKVGSGIELIAATITEDAATAATGTGDTTYEIPDGGTINVDTPAAAAAAGINGGTRSKVGIQWKHGVHKVVARYEAQADNVASNDASSIFAGYHFTLGKNIFTFQYGDVDADVAAEDQNYMMLAVKHKLSKKTATWVGYRVSDYKLSTSTKDNTNIVAGVRVNF